MSIWSRLVEKLVSTLLSVIAGASLSTVLLLLLSPITTTIWLEFRSALFRARSGDAVSLLRALGIRYVWIDSLCILQDSKEDWASEAMKMADVYSKAIFTISALSAASSKEGLYRDSEVWPELIFDWKMSGGFNSKTLGVRVSLPNFDEEVEASPLTPRAWVFQERMLSTAVLHFGRRQIFWECKTSMLSQAVPLVTGLFQTEEKEIMRRNLSNIYWRALEACQSGISPPWAWAWHWRNFVRMYSRKELTRVSDRYAAMLGIATKWRDVARCMFVAGVWVDLITFQLAWMCDESVDTPCQKAFRSPSWSWVSVDYPITWMSEGIFEPTPLANLFGRSFATDWQKRELEAFAKQDTKYFTLDVRGELAQPKIVQVEENKGRFYLIMAKNRGWQIEEARGVLDPGRAPPEEVYLLPLYHTLLGFENVDGQHDMTIYLVLERLDIPKKEERDSLGTFRRIGIGFVPYSAMIRLLDMGKQSGWFALV